MEWIEKLKDWVFAKKISIDPYKGLSDLPILTFWKITETGDHRFMDKLYKEDKFYSEAHLSQLADAFMQCYDKYFVLKNDEKSRKALGDKIKEFFYVMSINYVGEGFRMLLWTLNNKDLFNEDDYKKRVQDVYDLIEKASGVKINRKKTEQENIKQTERVLSAMISKHNRNMVDKKKEIKEQIGNVYKVVANVSKILEIQLNVKEMSVKEWLAYEEMAEEIVKTQKIPTKNGSKR